MEDMHGTCISWLHFGSEQFAHHILQNHGKTGLYFLFLDNDDPLPRYQQQKTTCEVYMK